MNIYMCSDHHLFHNKIIEFCRPQFECLQDMHETIIDNHNKVVKSDDIVYFLGDVCLSTSKQEDYDILHRFNGRKRLVIGNHDTPDRIKTYSQYFEKIYGYHTLGNMGGRNANIILSHIPVHPRELDDRFKYNIHGHLHTNVVRTDEGHPDLRYFCVSMEQIEYTPISLNQINEML